MPDPTPGWLTSWPTTTWPHIDYAEHATEEAAHRHALVKSREIAGEVAVIPMAQYDTTRKRATR